MFRHNSVTAANSTENEIGKRFVRIPLSDLEKIQEERPEGYLSKMLELGRVEGSFLVMESQVYAEACRQYRGVAQRTKSFLRAMRIWARAGFPLAGEEARIMRKAICRGCPNRVQGLIIPTCGICGCTDAKIWMATTGCPLGLW